MFTLSCRVIILIPLSLLLSEEYTVRARSYGVLSTVSPWLHISPVLEQSYSRSKDLESRRLLSTLIEHSYGYDYSGEWYITRANGKYSGGGTLHLWDNGRGEYRGEYGYHDNYQVVMSLTWSVHARILVLNYGAFMEIYAPGLPPKNSSWSINDLMIVKGPRTRHTSKTSTTSRLGRLHLYGLIREW